MSFFKNENFEQNFKDIEKLTEPVSPEPMSEEMAHNEANMIREKAGISPETGKIEGREPRSEDYDRAMVELQKLKALTLRNLDSVIASTTIIDEIINIPFLGAAFLRRFKNAIAGSPNGIGRRWQESESVTAAAIEKFFGETISEIRNSMKAGDEFAGKEVEHQTEAG